MDTEGLEIGTGDQQYGPLQPGLSFRIKNGYTVLTGRNNSGKSAILQFMFSKLVLDIREFGAGKVCLILPDRLFIERHAESRGGSLTAYNSDLANQLRSDVLHYENAASNRSTLGKLLLHQHHYQAQLQKMNQFLERLGFPELVLREQQNMHFEDILVTVQGSGLRTAFQILAALTNPQMEIVLIDEPELSLEPKIQKILRDLLQESGKKIVVATQSHLFLNRRETEIGSNYIVSKVSRNVQIEKVRSGSKLLELVFDLLGSSPNDLFFPENFLVVEGASDQEIVNRVLELKRIEKSKIFVVSAEGMNKVSSKINTFSEWLRPYIVEESFYRDRVVALIDLPNNDETNKQMAELKKYLSKGARLFLLNANSMEEYLAEEFYQKAGRTKTAEIKRIEETSKYEEERSIKKEISKSIAKKLELDDLDKIPEITNAIDKSLENL